MRQTLTPTHPGEILLEEFMLPLGLTQDRVAKETGLPLRRITEIVKARRAVTADTAQRLAKFFGTSEMFWLNLQSRYDLDVQRHKLGAGLNSVRPFVRPREIALPLRAAKALITSARSGSARSGHRRKGT